MTRTALIIATKDRPEDLRRTLESLSLQDTPVEQIIVVDGGEVSVEHVVSLFPRLNIDYLVCRPPSASRQRNAGVNAVRRDIAYIGFLDDDIVLEPSALSHMKEFLRNAPMGIGGAAFNMINQPMLFAGVLKKLPITEKLGLYSSISGQVLPSGFHTMMSFMKEDTSVHWLPTTAVIYRREALTNEAFDEWFEGYSYLEDLDVSYRIGRKFKLFVVSKAQYNHFPGSSGRGSPVEFGKREVLNRLYFVGKNKELSLSRCYLALHFRIVVNLAQGIREGRWDLIKRAWGNILGLAVSFVSPCR